MGVRGTVLRTLVRKPEDASTGSSSPDGQAEDEEGARKQATPDVSSSDGEYSDSEGQAEAQARKGMAVSSGDGEYSDSSSDEQEENMAQEELWEAGARKRRSAVQAIPKAAKRVHVPFRPARAPTR